MIIPFEKRENKKTLNEIDELLFYACTEKESGKLVFPKQETSIVPFTK